MKKMINPKFTAIALLIMCACGKSLPTLQQIDLNAWKNDRNACEGKRTSMIQAIDAQKEKLLGLSETQIVALLGNPDENNLYKRNQKFYYYYLQPSSSCASKTDNAQKLQVRFTAMGIAKEVSVEY
jgi:hypothetical protein